MTVLAGMSAVPIDVLGTANPRLSVAGMQPKLNLLELNGHLGLCDGDRLASDRILKFSSAARPLLLLNECMTMRLAAAAGWPTAKAGMRQVGVHQALEIMRFDRQAVAGTDGNMVVKRRHVIDGCQALGLPSAYKYERNYGDGRDVRHIREGANLLKLFGLASDADNPQAFINNLYDWVLFFHRCRQCRCPREEHQFFCRAKWYSAGTLVRSFKRRFGP